MFGQNSWSAHSFFLLSMRRETIERGDGRRDDDGMGGAVCCFLDQLVQYFKRQRR